jgi:predicted component of type VI protein secretion system
MVDPQNDGPKAKDAGGPPRQHLAERLSGELQSSAETCKHLQLVVSTLLEQLDNPKQVVDYHMLQELDRLHQILDDLAKLTGALDIQPNDPRRVAGVLKLTSLRHRLFPELTSEDTTLQDNTLTWL